MSRNRAKSFVWWLLPFLAARALLPAGFMADVASGDFKVVMCSEVIRFADTQSNKAADANVAKDAAHSGSATHAPCLFVASATAALAMTSGLPEFDESHQSHVFVSPSASFVIRDGKAHAIRGPPAFS